MPVTLAWYDVLFAAGVALTVTTMYNFFRRFLRMEFAKGALLDFHPGRSDEVLKRCHTLFPIDYLRFNNTTFRRGMEVRLVLDGQDVFVGKFVGTNENDMVCVVSKTQMMAREIHTIEEMYPVEGE